MPPTTPNPKYTAQFYPENQQGGKTQNPVTQSEGAPKGAGNNPQQGNGVSLPVVQMPKGGGAIKGIGEKFQANPVTGTGSMSIPLPVTPGRGGFAPSLGLSYDSGSGNSPFGLGWSVGIPSISRKTDKGLPKYEDKYESDVYLLAGAEDLIRITDAHGELLPPATEVVNNISYSVFSYRPRTEGLFAKIERWENNETKVSHWRVVTKDNITTLYGYSATSRIFHPTEPRKVFQWMVEISTDNKGNLIQYQYKRENSQNIPASIFDQTRLEQGTAFTNLYLKQVNYGNAAMVADLYQPYNGAWYFSLVFDYGEHTGIVPSLTPQTHWQSRTDAFSNFRAGFEIRTWRLCNRIIMFHNFYETGTNAVAVKMLTLQHELRPELTLLSGVVMSGIDENRNIESFPPVQFNYSQAAVSTELKKVDTEDLQNFSGGEGYRWVDLYGEGLNGLLMQTPNTWYYKSNYGEKGIYNPVAGDGDGLWLTGMKSLSSMPSITTGVQIGDLDGNGLTDVQVMAPGLKGFYEIEKDGNWEAFRAFKHLPNIDFNDPDLRMLDLTGDGHADILITENSCFTAYYSLAKEGYGPALKVSKAIDEEKGPRLVFSDANQQVFIADMSGDGLGDIVRIRNGSVDYWPNLGYSRFGYKIKMRHAPRYNNPGQLDGSRIRLADVDGTGTTDIIYLGTDAIRYWKNEAGNSWSEAIIIDRFPVHNALSDISVMDLLGNGTSCLVSIRQATAGLPASIYYLELTNGVKPFLMLGMNNNMGSVTTLTYKPSTYFYLTDRLNGKPWITKLPFPVHVVETVTIHDRPSDTLYATKYAYHHGYFDGREREFRGFGMVEQWDTVDLGITPDPNVELQAPILTKTWFHTGFYMEGQAISLQYLSEYYKEDSQAWLLPDTVMPSGLQANEMQEACRALRGNILRQEIYGLDNSSLQNHPYTVSENTYIIRKLQPKGKNPHAVFHVIESETLAYNYERDPDEPRIQHTLALETDIYGNKTQIATVAYPRRRSLPGLSEQSRLLVKYDMAQFINITTDPAFYRHSVPSSQQSYEFHNLSYSGLFTVRDLLVVDGRINGSGTISSEQVPFITNHQQPGTGLCLRTLSSSKVFYYNEVCTGMLPYGQIASHGLPYHSLSLAFTPHCLQTMTSFNTGINPLLPNATALGDLLSQSGFVILENQYWKPTPCVSFSPTKFFLPVKQTDPLGNCSYITYDSYNLLPIETKDAQNYTTTIVNDYYRLQPNEITDPNGSKNLVKYNALGMVTALAQDGAQSEGDNLSSPTIVYEYNLHNWSNNHMPVAVHVMARETHADGGTPWLHSYTYSDGLGREIQTKVQAEDGLAWVLVYGRPEQVDSTDRWVATGRKVYNNKGLVLKQYEPWFSTTSDYEPEDELTQYGVSPELHYDAAGRLIRTDFPDGTYSRIEFDAWKQINFDRNDCVADSQWLVTMLHGNEEEHRAATLTLAHSDTPQIIDLDTLGRPYQVSDDAGQENRFITHNHIDIAGLTVKVTDALGRDMTTHVYDTTGQMFYTFNIDSGHRWMLTNAMDMPVYLWDSRRNKIELSYDELLRPIGTKLNEDGSQSSKLVEAIEYGTDASSYTIGRPVNQMDQAGQIHNKTYDFKGNPLEIKRLLLRQFQGTIDWREEQVFETFELITGYTYDALNRPISETGPDGKIKYFFYNKAGLLEQLEFAKELYITNINYNEKGQRTDIYFGNNSKTRYDYDPLNFRLTRLLTTRNTGQDILQDLYYTYDPEGNIVQQTDKAQQTFYFGNQVIDPTGKYEYDALYRLVKAEGRELTGLNMPDNRDFPNEIQLPDPDSLQNYSHTYTYDALGNILRMVSDNWHRDYQYKTTNNLLNGIEDEHFEYRYDAHGNLLAMPHLETMTWDYNDRLSSSAVNRDQQTLYRYGAGGNRTRKITQSAPNLLKERIYFANFEIYRERSMDGEIITERLTNHIADGNKRIAMVDSLTIDQGHPIEPKTTIRYQYDNHLGSACLELDERAEIISYEEYHPFGTTSYRSGRSLTETSLKRYKYVGKERDEETGLYYYGARYYAAWLCRFVSVDPLQHKYPHYTPYQYAGNKPVSYIDLDGLEEAKKTENPISIYYNYSIPQLKTTDTVMANYVTTENRKAVNVEMEVATSIIAEIKAASKLLKVARELPGIVDDFNQAIENNDFSSFATQYGTEGFLKASEYIAKKASEDVIVGDSRPLFKNAAEKLDKLRSLAGAGFSLYNIYSEINSPATESEALADLTFFTMKEAKLGNQNYRNTGVFTFNTNYSGEIGEAKLTVNQTFAGIEKYFSSFDLTNPEHIEVIKSIIQQNASRIIYDSMNLPNSNKCP
jgi:RHS repeat-associated protein